MKPHRLLVLFALGAAAAPRASNQSSDASELEIKGSAASLRDIIKRQAPISPKSISAAEASIKSAPGGGKSGVFYRGDSRPPSEIFKSGFKPQGEDRSLLNHLSFRGDSGLVSLSRSPKSAQEYAFGRSADKYEKGYVYVVAPKDIPNGYWVPGLFPPNKNPAVSRNQEFAVDGAVPGSSVSHAYEVTRNNPSSKAKRIQNNDYALKSSPQCSIQKRAICDPSKFADDEDIFSTTDGEPTITNEEVLETPEEFKAVELAESVSEKEFADLAAARGLTALAKERWSLDLRSVRAKLLGYQPLTPKSPKFRVAKLGSGAIAALGGGVWIAGIVDVFTKDATALDRAAAVTSIIPFVGCGVNAAAELEKDKINEIDTAMCVLGDGLILSPLMPLGLAVHVVRAIVAQFNPPPLPQKKEIQKARDDSWTRFLNNKIYAYIYSDKSLFPNKSSFRDKLNSSLAIEALAVLSEGAQSIGALQTALDSTISEEEKSNIQYNTKAAAFKIRASISNEIIRRQRRLLLGLPNSLKNSTALSLTALADEYNKDFIAEVTSRKMINKYKQTYVGDPEIPMPQPTNEDDVRNELNEIGLYLNKTPVLMPSPFDLAYIIGQSKGLEGIDPLTLSPQAYIKDQVSEASDSYIDMLSLHHTLEVARLLQGKRTQDRLSDLWPSENADANNARQLQILIAMKYGRVYEEWKIAETRNGFSGDLSFFVDRQEAKIIRYLTQPDIRPTYSTIEKPRYTALIIGLGTEVINNLSKQMQSGQLYRETAAIQTQAQRLGDMFQSEKFQMAMLGLEIKFSDGTRVFDTGYNRPKPVGWREILQRSETGY